MGKESSIACEPLTQWWHRSPAVAVKAPMAMQRRRLLARVVLVLALGLACMFGIAVALAACALYAGSEGASSSVRWRDLTGEDGTEAEPGSVDLLGRAVCFTIVLLPVALAAPLAFLSAAFRRWVFYPLVGHSLGAGGPALQKWGQWSATRPDMFPMELCEVLRSLHSSVPPHSWRHTKQEVETALRQPLLEYFAEFSQEPIASGSIAQVHKAVLRENGETVAVKVRHPRVMEQLWLDVQLMRGVAWAVDSFIPAFRFLHLPATVAQFSHTIADQARLDVEAESLREMRRNFAVWGWRDVSIPRPIYGAPAMIVESFEPGATVGQMRHRLSHVDSRYIVNRGLDVYLKMLMADRLMHADLHPGNILIALGSDEPKIVLVDLGMVARLGHEEQMHFVGMIRALGYGDGRRAAEHVLNFVSQGDEQACVGEQAEAFKEDTVQLFKRVCRGFGTDVDFGEVLRGVLALVRKHQVTISSSYATLVVNALCLDGMAVELAPEYNLLDGCASMMRASSILQFRWGAWLLRRLYPALSALKSHADANFRKLERRKEERMLRGRPLFADGAPTSTGVGGSAGAPAGACDFAFVARGAAMLSNGRTWCFALLASLLCLAARPKRRTPQTQT
eukprot:TRINITY_DN18839_c0_g1_i1.p1 TRINITY_DN18839_c0_g1~~TRINITY_DN18839_c0_g1_i1.p1  ORF type:complete len:622 (+),score=106.69 TRINITY_DN18839_c0_g1_i1:63-1928(+)